jgi:hypothetical protein
MKSATLSAWLVACLAAAAIPAQAASGRQDIEQVLEQSRTWTYYWESTEQTVPGATAGKGTMEFFRRDGKLFARTTHMVSGNCEFEVGLRDDGFTWEICGGYQFPRSSVSFDPADARFPFKNLALARKTWFEPAKTR